MEYNQELQLTFDAKTESTRDGIGKGMVKLGEINDQVVVLCADLPDSTRVKEFKEKYPERYFDLGVAEQNMAGVSAGLALSGKIPYMASFGVFSPGRNWDQIRVSITYSRANVKILASHTGLGSAEDGASHQALEDIALTRVLPGMTVIAPSDSVEAMKAAIAAASIPGPVYIRYAKPAMPIYTTEATPFTIGKANVYTFGHDITILSTGITIASAMDAALELEQQGISAEVINVHTIKPLDEETILTSLRKTNCFVTIEDHQVMAGFGSAILELVSKHMCIPSELIGMQDSFGESGPFDALFEKYGIHKNNVVSAVHRVLDRKKL